MKFLQLDLMPAEMLQCAPLCCIIAVRFLFFYSSYMYFNLAKGHSQIVALLRIFY